MNKCAIYSCSHRKGGNSDKAAELFAQGLAESGAKAELFTLRNHKVMHCLACDKCLDSPQNTCVLGERDDAEKLFAPLTTSPFVFFSTPVYFYHLPSMFKTWIDRGQRFWNARRKGNEQIANLAKRPAFACLVAGSRGDSLFDGSLLTLKYFLENFNLELKGALTLRAVDAKNDLEFDRELSAGVLELGRKAAQSCK